MRELSSWLAGWRARQWRICAESAGSRARPGTRSSIAIRNAASKGSPTEVGEPLDAAFLIAIEDLVPGLARDPELSAQIRHCLARQPASHELNSLIHHRTLLPRHPLSSPKGKKV